jgi:hypothetical protein
LKSVEKSLLETIDEKESALNYKNSTIAELEGEILNIRQKKQEEIERLKADAE